MRRPLIALAAVVALLAAALVLAPGTPAPAAERPKEPLVDQVDKAIKSGKAYLLKEQTADGDWEKDTAVAQKRGGGTALVLLALLNAGVPPDDPAVRKGLKYLREVPLTHTYVVGLQTMVYCLAGESKERIEKNARWLLDARQKDGKKLLGWSYDTRGGPPDNSNTQYALLGLHEAQLAGVPIDALEPGFWATVRDYYLNTQFQGGYVYQNRDHSRGPTLTMTTAGLCGLIIAGSDLKTGREKPRGDGTWEKCGEYEDNRAVKIALEWVSTHFPAADRWGTEQHPLYALYGLERAGRLTGLRFFGEHDWYRVGCEFLVGRQNDNGSWRSTGDGGGPMVSTSFALLFLSKGRTPILVSKLTHDGVGRKAGVAIRIPAKSNDDGVNDWNNDRSDARHLVDFAGRELFKRQPMGWQVFNAHEADPREGPDELAAELLQSPIAYFNGHLAPDFSGREREMLQKYVRSGGLIFAEACCGSKQFDEGFRKLMTGRDGLFPDLELKRLPDDHPVWAASVKFAIPPKQRGKFPLYGIQMGCKLVVIYSPADLSCRWESNQYADKGDNELAFHVGANVIAYATGLEPPKPRLTPMEVAPDLSRETKAPPRGFLKVGQLRYGPDWRPAPDAMPNLMREVRQKTGLDVALKTEEVVPTNANDMAAYKFLYMHGRGAFALPKDRLGDLRFNLEHGGLLLADACCGSETFDKSFRAFVGDLWPDKKYKLGPIPLKDELYGKELNGTAIKTVRCRHRTGGKPDEKYAEYEPALEGVKVGGRWAVIYSKYDIGCALEKTKSPDCVGHDYDSAVKLGRAAVLYYLH